MGSDTYGPPSTARKPHGRLLLVPWLVEGLTALALVFVLSGGKESLLLRVQL